jgi:hypothetical protein
MSTTRKGLTTFIVSPAGTINCALRVKYIGANQISLAGVADVEVGVTKMDKTSNGVGFPAPVQLTSEPGSVFLTVDGPIADGATVYRGANGLGSAAGAQVYGTALEASAEAGDLIEVLPTP